MRFSAVREYPFVLVQENDQRVQIPVGHIDEDLQIIFQFAVPLWEEQLFEEVMAGVDWMTPAPGRCFAG